MNNKVGPWLFWVAAFLVLPLWLISFPESTIRHNLNPFLVYVSQVTALTGFALFAITFVLSARLKWLEDYFGGLDKMYHQHHKMGKAAFMLLLIHPIMLAISWVPEDAGRLLWYLFPVHGRFEINIGSWALWSLILLMIFTLVIRMPYDKWKISHKFMGIFFILGVVHIYYLDLSLSANTALTIYLSVLSIAGITAWVYKSVLFDFVIKKYHFRVVKVDRLSDEIIQITLKPIEEAFDFTPGQFCFFSFRAAGISRESHPYTVCDMTKEGEITIMVKALGDYTKQLYRELEHGAIAYLEGPYGRFDYREGSRNQVWIGGGVGIAPFISWANDLKRRADSNVNVDLYYCVNTEEEATHLPVFKDLEMQMESFRINLIRADVEGFLNPAEIPHVSEKEIFICGPKEMRKALLPKLAKHGVSKESIHYEDFDFS
ncbi:ferredoxin reductase family protein [Rhodohalobacter sp. 8-1]|uniref:ferredoxin reductase family protein n=1 Tax=Rhodohalobacter sp. 8-1 TaxID=3131972 RepID=UPI0030ED48C3